MINFVNINGVGKVITARGTIRDVYVYGYFTYDRFMFIVHEELTQPEYVTVSEASTGYQLKKECYYNVDDALEYAYEFLELKRLYLATIILNTRVKWQRNLEKCNTTLLKTPAIDLILWNGN